MAGPKIGGRVILGAVDRFAVFLRGATIRTGRKLAVAFRDQLVGAHSSRFVTRFQSGGSPSDLQVFSNRPTGSIGDCWWRHRTDVRRRVHSRWRHHNLWLDDDDRLDRLRLHD